MLPSHPKMPPETFLPLPPHTFLGLPCMVCEILVPGSRTQTRGPWQCKHRVLTTGLPGTPSPTCLQYSSLCLSFRILHKLTLGSKASLLSTWLGPCISPRYLLPQHYVLYCHDLEGMSPQAVSNKREILSHSPRIYSCWTSSDH